MRRFTLLLAVCALPLAAQTVKILVQNPQILKELQAGGDLPSQARLVGVTGDTLGKEIVDADAILVGGGLRPEHLQAGKKLRWVQTFSAGVEQLLHRSGSNFLRDSNIILTNNQVVQGPEIADHAFAMLLTLTRQIPKYIANRQKGVWQGGNEGLLELNGRTAVVIGVGGIGFNIATRAWAFGMTVIGVDPEDYAMTPIVSRYVKPDRLDEVLPQADVVFVSAPHTEMSHKMVGSKQFALMKQNSFFIAVSRGSLYDLSSLVTALDSRRLAGAGVDVTDPEPLPQGHALWKFDNVLITPHIAGRSDKDHARMLGTVRENIKRFAAGQPLVNVVDKQKGY